MIMKLFLFPRSMYLTTHWWHRLAMVIFWAWLLFVTGYFWNVAIDEPFSSCINANFILQKQVTDCGGNVVGFVIQNVKEFSPSEIGLALITVSVVLYVAIAVPSFLYRLVLYIAKGDNWRDAKQSQQSVSPPSI